MHRPNGKKTNGVFRRLYGLVRAFLKDFYAESKRGTLQHKKGIAIFLSFVLLCLYRYRRRPVQALRDALLLRPVP